MVDFSDMTGLTRRLIEDLDCMERICVQLSVGRTYNTGMHRVSIKRELLRFYADWFLVRAYPMETV